MKSIFDALRAEDGGAVFIDLGQLTHESMTPDECRLLIDLVDSLDYDVVNCYLSDFVRLGFLNGQEADTSIIEKLSVRYEIYGTSDISYLKPERSARFPNFVFIFGKLCYPNPFSIYGKPESYLPFYSGKIQVSEYRTVRWTKEIIFQICSSLSPKKKKFNEILPKNTVFLDSYKHTNDYLKDLKYPDRISLKHLSILVENTPDSVDQFDEIYKNFQALCKNWQNLDLMILSGGGYVMPEARNVYEEMYRSAPQKFEFDEDKIILLAYPGDYNEFVLVLDIWTEDGSNISRYEWERIPTESVRPDSTFQALIDSCCNQKEQPKGTRKTFR